MKRPDELHTGRKSPELPHEHPSTHGKGGIIERVTLGPADDLLHVEIHPGAEVAAPPADELDFSVFGAKKSSVSTMYTLAHRVAEMPFVIDQIVDHAERRAWESRLEARGGHEHDLARASKNKLSTNKLGQALLAINAIHRHAGHREDKALEQEINTALEKEPSVNTLTKQLQEMEERTI